MTSTRKGTALEAQYREAIKRLTENQAGMSVDRDCPNCGHPEMSGAMRLPGGKPISVTMCRKCGHAIPQGN